jgi:acyl carrier protein
MKIINQIEIKEILGLDEDDFIERSQNLSELSWDSLAMVMLQTHVDEKYDIQIDPDNLPDLKTIGCLDDYINSFK